MKRTAALTAALLCLSACKNPRATKIPANIADIETIRPQLDQLDSADRRRVAAYEMRAHMGGIFGGDAPAASVTIGEAIDKEKALELLDSLQADSTRRVAAKVRARAAALSRLITTQIDSVQRESTPMGTLLKFPVYLRNNTQKDIAGVKGEWVFFDVFGDTAATESYAYTRAIPAGATVRDGAGVLVSGMMEPGFEKIQDAPIEKIRRVFVPSAIVFADGTRMDDGAQDSR